MANPILTIRTATSADAPALGVIGPAAYAASYGHIWDDPVALSCQLDTFNADAFRTFICSENTWTWIAEIDNRPVGFLTMVTGSPDPITLDSNGAEIARIYLLPGAQKRGLGQMLLQSAVSEATREQLDYVWLDVMAYASTAVETYRKWGFIDIGTKLFARPVRAGFDDKIVFRKSVRSNTVR